MWHKIASTSSRDWVPYLVQKTFTAIRHLIKTFNYFFLEFDFDENFDDDAQYNHSIIKDHGYLKYMSSTEKKYEMIVNFLHDVKANMVGPYYFALQRHAGDPLKVRTHHYKTLL